MTESTQFSGREHPTTPRRGAAERAYLFLLVGLLLLATSGFLIGGGATGASSHVHTKATTPEHTAPRISPGEAGPALRASDDPHAVVQGMTISCQTWGWEWGTDEMASSMKQLSDIGVNWIAIHPYARIRDDGTVSFREIDPENPPEWLARPIREAHALGQKILIKPHIAYWGSGFSWRGEIEFDSIEEWRRFFESYTTWIVTIAKASRGADAFCVGTELDRTVRFEDAWRSIIRQVDEVTDMPLTYAANWDRYESVGFWDALDCIGIQAYFPLLEEGAPVTRDALTAAWQRRLDNLYTFASAHDRRIVFSELGYDRTSDAAFRPWQAGRRRGTHDDGLVQQLCLQAALEAISSSEVVVGAFLWKWFPGEPALEDFRMYRPPVRAIIAEAWRPPLAVGPDQ